MHGTFPVDARSQTKGLSPALHILAGLRGGRFWVLPTLMLLFVVLVVLALLLADPTTRTYIIGASLFLSMVFALICNFLVSLRSPRGRATWAWRCMALALASYVSAEILTIALFSNTGNTANAPASSIADILFLPFYPLLVLAILLLPPEKAADSRQLRAFLDAGLAVGALLGLGLVFLIIPRFASGTTVDYVFIAYPVGDLIVLVALIVLLVRGVQRLYAPTLFWLAVGMICFTVADSGFNYLTLPGSRSSYTVGTPSVDPFWLAGAFAFSLAALHLLVQGRELGPGWGWLTRFTTRAQDPRTAPLPSYLALLLAPAALLFGLLIYTAVVPQAAHVSLIWLTLLVFVLVIVRQLLTQRDLAVQRLETARARQLEALKDQFITHVNHELRTPLMTVSNFIAIFKKLQENKQAQSTPQKLIKDAPRSRQVLQQVLENSIAQVKQQPLPNQVTFEAFVEAVEACISLVAAVEREQQAEQPLPELLEYAAHASTELVTMTERVLGVRNIDHAAPVQHPQPVNVWQTVESAWSLVNPATVDRDKERRLLVNVPPELSIWGDAGRFHQILINLLSNAIKYSPDGAPVEVTAFPVGKGGRFEPAAWRGGQVALLVRDYGPGIPPDQIPLLFHRFVRLERDLASNVRGTGLGLYLCRMFAEAMGGTIGVTSTGTPGEGATFRLILPAASTYDGPGQDRPAASLQSPLAGTPAPQPGMERSAWR